MGEKYKAELKRINGYLKEVVTFFDDTGKPIGHVMNPLMVEEIRESSWSMVVNFSATMTAFPIESCPH